MIVKYDSRVPGHEWEKRKMKIFHKKSAVSNGEMSAIILRLFHQIGSFLGENEWENVAIIFSECDVKLLIAAL